jgi:hypothetical protein
MPATSSLEGNRVIMLKPRDSAMELSEWYSGRCQLQAISLHSDIAIAAKQRDLPV